MGYYLSTIQQSRTNAAKTNAGDTNQALQLGAGVKIGQRAIAMGTPFGLVGGPTVTVGIVSAFNRSIQTQVSFMEQLIQTDAAINPVTVAGR